MLQVLTVCKGKKKPRGAKSASLVEGTQNKPFCFASTARLEICLSFRLCNQLYGLYYEKGLALQQLTS